MKKVLLFVSAIVAVFCMSASANAAEVDLGAIKANQVYPLTSGDTTYATFTAPVAGKATLFVAYGAWFTDPTYTTEAATSFGGYAGTLPNGQFGGQFSTYDFKAGETLYYKDSAGWGGNLCVVMTVPADVETGVNAISVNATNAPVYNLNGVKVGNDLQALPAGLYIVNGKKVVVK